MHAMEFVRGYYVLYDDKCEKAFMEFAQRCDDGGCKLFLKNPRHCYLQNDSGSLLREE